VASLKRVVAEAIIATARELFVLAALVVVFAWIGYQLVRTSRS
jgi:hypothetical protein